MKYYYENQGAVGNFYISLDEEDTVDELTMGMITHNSIPGLAPAVYSQMNDQRTVRYEVSEKVPLSTLFESIMNKRKILSLLSGILSGINSCSDFLLDEESLMLNINHIFVNPKNLSVSLICSPVEKKQFESEHEQDENDDFDLDEFEKESMVDYKKVFMNILLAVRFNKNESGEYLRYLVNYLDSDIKFRLQRFSALITDLQAGNPITPSDYGLEAIDDSENEQRIVMPIVEQPKVEPVKVVEVEQVEEVEKEVDSAKKSLFGFFNKKKDKAEKAGGLGALRDMISGLESKLSDEEPSSKKSGENKHGSNNAKFEIPNANGGIAIPAASPREGVEKKPVQEKKSVPSNNRSQDRGNYGGTMYINPDKQRQMSEDSVGDISETPYITYCRNGLAYPITKKEYVIGRNKDEVDCFLDNATVGRTHAKIVVHDSFCEIYDLGSVNKTFVNGFMVSPDKPAKLQAGDRIRISNEEFDFDYK